MLTKLNKFAGPGMQEFAIWHCVGVVHVHQLQHQRPFRHNARAAGQEVGADHCLQHRRLAGTLCRMSTMQTCQRQDLRFADSGCLPACKATLLPVYVPRIVAGLIQEAMAQSRACAACLMGMTIGWYQHKLLFSACT